MEFGCANSIHHLVHVAEHQVGGRGRRSRKWLTPYLRGLAISVGYETTNSVFALQGLSLAVGVAVCTALRAAGAKECGLKWPNDVVFRNSKLAGILVEHQMWGGKSQYVIGIGINVEISAEERARIDQPVIDLRELGVAGDRTTIGCAVIKSVFDHVHGFVEDGRSAYVRSFKELHLYQGLDCVVTLANESVAGRIVDIDEDGSLVLSVRGALRKFVSGDVSVRGIA
jgi:BirA family biotin operon repressor/biotin-[acetyl-CoA-carboxylase] ligase